MAPSNSYHDLSVIVNGKVYVPSNDYGLSLTCTRVGGWELWGGESLIGGEFNYDAEFKIKMGDVVVFDASLKEA